MHGNQVEDSVAQVIHFDVLKFKTPPRISIHDNLGPSENSIA
jgi:hypothetical protein